LHLGRAPGIGAAVGSTGRRGSKLAALSTARRNVACTASATACSSRRK
jgi:hypothetical protein